MWNVFASQENCALHLLQGETNHQSCEFGLYSSMTHKYVSMGQLFNLVSHSNDIEDVELYWPSVSLRFIH